MMSNCLCAIMRQVLGSFSVLWGVCEVFAMQFRVQLSAQFYGGGTQGPHYLRQFNYEHFANKLHEGHVRSDLFFDSGRLN